MQDELLAANLDIQIVGINQVGYESGNQLIPSFGELPWLQDVDANGNGASDVWTTSWDVVYRDVVIVDQHNVKLGTFNLTEHNLADPERYARLKETLIQVADDNPIWQNDVEPLDVNNDSVISPAGDVLACINELNNRLVSDERGFLPVPAPTTEHFFFDVNGDYQITPVGDVLTLINHLNRTTSAEGEAGALPAEAIQAGAFLVGAPPAAAAAPAELGGPPGDSEADSPAESRDSAAAFQLLVENQHHAPAADDEAPAPETAPDAASPWPELLEDLARQWHLP